MIYDVAIIGAGVIGGAVARELAKYKLSSVILEKENDVAVGASKANSGIVHGGFDPEPDTLKAKLNILGVEKLFDAAKELHFPIKRNGSFVCAFSEQERAHIKELYDRGIQNGVPDMRILSGDEARKLEPELSGEVVEVLDVRNAGIVCPYELTLALIGNAMDNGTELKVEFRVEKIEKSEGIFTISSQNGEIVTAKTVINCAGAGSGKISAIAGDNSFEIIPRAGEYILLDKDEGKRVTHTIFQCPTKEGKGILVSPTVDGNLLTGPTANKVESADNTGTTISGLDTVMALSKKSVPTVNFRNSITSFTGVRSSEKNGDFIIAESDKVKGFINVGAIDSPGLSSCLAIAEYVAEIMKGMGIDLEENPNFNPTRENPHAFREMSDEQKNEFIKKNADYGKIVCRCETVSEGEIRAAIRRNPPARDLDGVKRRTRSGMGRCQGGFCAPYVMELIANERGIKKEEVTKKGSGSYMVIEKL
ncbi:MAG: FAD-dependent oxidoreductase [Clostridia bacterium]|nr:FAD-dependent oxidoreductase [Clostridia bacterium]